MVDKDKSTQGGANDGTLSTNQRRRWPLIVAIVVVLGLLVVGFGIWWFFIRDDSPRRGTAEDVAATLGECGDPGDIAGAWTVDPSIGTPGEPGGTYAGYRIQEEIADIGGQTAVGRTADVTGGITIEGDQVTEATFEVDMTTLESDEQFRDGRLRDSGLETDTFPTSSFTLTEPIDLPEEATSGETLTYQATGELELHGVTQPITADLEAQLCDGEMGILTAAPIVLADYDIEKPSSPVVLGIADEGEFELGVFLTQG